MSNFSCFPFIIRPDVPVREEQRALGFNEFFSKIAPEYQEWITNDASDLLFYINIICWEILIVPQFSPKVRAFKTRVLGPTVSYIFRLYADVLSYNAVPDRA